MASPRIIAPWPGGSSLAERPITDADRAPLWRLHVDTMRDYVAATYGWVDADQEQFFRARWESNLAQRVLVDGTEIVAAWLFRREPDHFFLQFVEVATSHQRRGLGTVIVQRFLAEAAAASVPASLTVMKANPRAMSLYERLGFSVEGETATHFRMVAKRAPVHSPRAMSPSSVREGFHTVTPYLTTPDADALVLFLTRGLGGVETSRGRGGSGGLHIEVRVGDSMVMVGGSARTQNAMLYLYVEDPDASYARAIAEGATSMWEPTDTPDGERRAGVVDAFGNQWFFGRPRG